MSGIAAQSYDPFSKEVLEDPWPAYAALREHTPVHFFGGFEPPFYTISRHADVRAALGDAERFTIRYGQSPQYTRAGGLMNDPPEHTPFRQMFNRAFTPRVISRLERRMQTLSTELLDAMAPAGRADFQTAYASPFPTTLIAELLGIPAEDHLTFRAMSDALTATYNEPDPAVSAPPRRAFDQYFQKVLDARRERLRELGIHEPDASHVGSALPDDLISRFVVGRIDDRLAEDRELHWLLLLLLLGGNETSTALLTNLLWRLLAVPERWEAVKADPRLIEVAVEESLRFDSPVLGLFRCPTQDLVLHGVTLPAKSKVMLLFASANRDPAVFEDPDSFRLDRDPEVTRRNLLTFGYGAHYCPGAALARLEAQVTLEQLIERMPGLRLAGEPTRIVPFNLWGRASLPLAW